VPWEFVIQITTNVVFTLDSSPIRYDTLLLPDIILPSDDFSLTGRALPKFQNTERAKFRVWMQFRVVGPCFAKAAHQGTGWSPAGGAAAA
jgi:hypothetical protein